MNVKQFPTFIEEEALWRAGYRTVAGIDEVGRGPLAGPVVAAAVIFPPDFRSDWLCQVNDSKKLTPKKREVLSNHIFKEALCVGIGEMSSETIDTVGIAPATRAAMHTALGQLSRSAAFLLIDALVLPEIDLPQKAIIKGDSLSLSIAAASIVAKVHRDQLMREYDLLYPGYGFASNKGYGTAKHMQGLQAQGCCPIHRRSFAPISTMEK